MLLLILMYTAFCTHMEIIYIPLCFYLYLTTSSNTLFISFIYIPLCFYLYCTQPGHKYSLYKFTFHYASTYTVVVFDDPVVSIQIYIPLCFYLYAGVGRVIDGVEAYLHSTMLLLIPSHACGYSSGLKYLHSTMLLLIHYL